MGSRRGAVPLVELAEDWLHAKAATARSVSGHSARARRQDLAVWGRLLRAATGHATTSSDATGGSGLSLEKDLAGLRVSVLSTERLIGVVDALRARYRPASVARQVSTMRSFCRWLTTRGHLVSNPFDDELLTVPTGTEPDVRAFTVEQVEAMLTAAATPPPRARSAWAARDVAIIDTLSSTGVRAGECCALHIGDIARLDRPILHVRRATKSGKRREIPLPRHTMARLDVYLDERATRGFPIGLRGPLFVRANGQRCTTDALYHLVKRLAGAAGVAWPDDALVHGLRHHYGLQLALRGLPPATLQQLMGHSDPRTTALYTRHASHDLVNALDDAGWL